MHTLHLSCDLFCVDVRVAGMNGRWIASVDTPDGPSLGLAFTPRRALLLALEPFEGAVAELPIEERRCQATTWSPASY